MEIPTGNGGLDDMQVAGGRTDICRHPVSHNDQSSDSVQFLSQPLPEVPLGMLTLAFQ